MFGLVKRVFKSINRRQLEQYKKVVENINSLEEVYLKMSDADLKAQTSILKTRLSKGETLDSILPNAFAIVRETSKRILNQRHFDVQLIAGMVLHDGNIAEMKTGEGKTLAATLPSYLNALEGKGVHVVTVNDYLAKWQSEMMSKVHNFLGLTCGCILSQMNDKERKMAYACDITYGTNSEFGFDYLRDNMKMSMDQMVQRGLNFAIVDEVDSILIDEARTPLIISGSTDDNPKLYTKIDSVIKKIKKTETTTEKEKDNNKDALCIVDEKDRQVTFTEKGFDWIDKELKNAGLVSHSDNMFDQKYMEVNHHINQALKANKLFQEQVDYIVKDGQVYIVDEFTGRIMEGRRFSDGLHQALEAKEGLRIQSESQTLASITYQNYFRMYEKLSGMTGTAMTEAVEFEFIYGLKTIEIPTNRPVLRKDEHDVIYKTEDIKYKKIVEQIEECYARKQPVLVGTISVEKSEKVSKLLKARKIPHQVLNAKQHEKEGKIIAQAGRSGAITIATNMAGRGTDIMLGGNADFLINGLPENERESQREQIKLDVENDRKLVLELGGLYILGTERHESRRIDNQLRGRSGRQGDPGQSKFFLSMEDDLLRIFGGTKLGDMMGRLGLEEDEAIIHPWISSSVEKAQKKVENAHYEMRKNILRYDDVVNEQRLIVFEQRNDIIKANHINEEIKYLREQKNIEYIDRFLPDKTNRETWDLSGLKIKLEKIYAGNFAFSADINKQEILDYVNDYTISLYEEKERQYTAEVMREIEKQIFLFCIDKYWKDHLRNLDFLRQGIGYRGYAQKDPLLEYKKEAFELFESLLYEMNQEILRRLYYVVITSQKM
ncbi:MAG: preprotein translocase subunit SecA [Rickettsiales bacterium]|jgi:preprotein translocase subunit SecA|nr:preprotein translocase subunit SecA [Rickettsiales bacterium]